MPDTLTELYIAAIDDEIKNIQLKILNGGCPDFAEYKHRVGILQGLEISKQLIEHELDTIAQLQNTDED